MERKISIVNDDFLSSSKKTPAQIFIDGEYEDYLEFIKGQPKEKKLKWEEFQEIQLEAKTVSLNQEHADPDLIRIFHLGSTFEMFKRIKESSFIEKSENCIYASYFTYMCEVAEESNDLFTSDEYGELKRRLKSVQLMKDKSAQYAYEVYQERLAKILALDRGSRLDQHLLKVALEKHIYSAKEMKEAKLHLLQLPVNEFYKIIHDKSAEDSDHPENLEYRRFLK